MLLLKTFSDKWERRSQPDQEITCACVLMHAETVSTYTPTQICLQKKMKHLCKLQASWDVSQIISRTYTKDSSSFTVQANWGGPSWLSVSTSDSSVQEGQEGLLRELQAYQCDLSTRDVISRPIQGNQEIRCSQHGFLKSSTCLMNLILSSGAQCK